jgi:ferric-dicitrate binding protein FerR (iron transport regulator)/DNA-binding FrmR family transcriptional regulator
MGKTMRQDELLLNKGIQALQSAEPDAVQLSASAARVAAHLGLGGVPEMMDRQIESCDDVQHLLAAYRAGALSSARSQLVQAHIRDCGACRRSYHGGSSSAVNWSAPKPAHAPVWRPQVFGWTFASAVAALVVMLFVYKAYWEVPPGVRAEVQSIDGAAYRISDSGDRPLASGDQLKEGDHLRTSGGAHAVLRLTDGSTVELNERTQLAVGARGYNTTIALDGGDVIVKAARRTSGHLYVRTPDCRVAVTGTIFSVDSGIKGSRVGVLQGTVNVSHAGINSVINAGDQITTNDNLTPAPVAQQIAWSHDREQYLPLLAQFTTLERRIEQIPFPASRYSSDLLEKVPADTLLYVSIPNLGEFLSEANRIFDDQLKQSPALQQWWSQGHDQNTAELDALVEKIHQGSQYLGNEIVVVGVQQAGKPGFAVVADVEKNGLDDFLNAQFPASAAKPGITVLNEAALAATPTDSKMGPGGYALIGPNHAIFSGSIATLKAINAQMNSGASGFAAGDFGKQIASAYTRGAGIILAADLHQIMADKVQMNHAGNHGQAMIAKSGVEDVRYLIAEHREVNGQPENRVNLQFAGARQGIASWLASPAPIGSLEFITPNAAVAVAALSKDPAAIADDIMAMAVSKDGDATQKFSAAESKLQINFRDDLAATLGGDFLLSLDGPVLPTPAWKAVIEVNDSARLEQTLEKLTEAIRNQTQGTKAHSIAIESSDAGGQLFYAVHDLTSGAILANYTYSSGYMIVAPSRALVMEALQTYASGNSLARSASFKALLPKDADENYSAIAYQNLTPVMTPLLSQFTGETADALRQLASDARPTVICARGEESSIQAASDSHLFGFDFLTLQTLLNLGNKHTAANVQN